MVSAQGKSKQRANAKRRVGKWNELVAYHAEHGRRLPTLHCLTPEEKGKQPRLKMMHCLQEGEEEMAPDHAETLEAHSNGTTRSFADAFSKWRANVEER